MGHPQPLLFILCMFSNKHYNLINVKISNQYRVLGFEPMTSEQESPPIPTAPSLPTHLILPSNPVGCFLYQSQIKALKLLTLALSKGNLDTNQAETLPSQGQLKNRGKLMLLEESFFKLSKNIEMSKDF